MSSLSEPKTTIFIAIIIITIVIVLGVSIAGLIIATETKSKVADVEKENESMKTQITTVQNGVTNVDDRVTNLENEHQSMKTEITTKRIIIDRRGEIDGYALGLYAPGGNVLEGPYIRFLNGQADLSGFIMGSGGSSKGAPTLNAYG
jgi:uncharacterized protein YpmS